MIFEFEENCKNFNAKTKAAYLNLEDEALALLRVQLQKQSRYLQGNPDSVLYLSPILF